MTPPADGQRIAVLGAGTWGVVLAANLARLGHRVRAWDVSSDLVDALSASRLHPRLPGFSLPPEVQPTADLPHALDGADLAVIALPSSAVRAACQTIRDQRLDAALQAWIICSKGIETDSLLLLSEVLEDVLGPAAADRIGVLSGPSHAEEVARGLPTTVVSCAASPDLARRIQSLFFSPHFRVYTSDDLVGVQLGGALKNVIAIAAGVSDGIGFGDNARAALVTRGLAEIVRLGRAMGARPETFMGLSGLGDLVVTTGSPHSRNHRFGELLAKGRSCEEALDEVGMVVEGYATTRAALGLGRKFGVQMPICEAVYLLLYVGLPAPDAIEGLLARDPKPEQD